MTPVPLSRTSWWLTVPACVLCLLGAAAAASATQDKSGSTTDGDGGQHPAKSLTAQAGDPTAPLLQFQVTNFYSPDVRNGDGYANQLNFQPVLPLPPGRVIPVEQVLRMTVPYLTSPGPDRKSGLGDVDFLDVFVPHPTPKDVFGIGFTLTMPTASDSRLGSGSWQIGPAATWVYYGIENWQIGGILQNPISFAGEGDRESVNILELQPVINYVWGDWYFGAGDFNAVWDWEESEATVPLAFQVGKIQKIGRHSLNLSAEFEWTAIYPDDAVVPRWGIKLGFVLLLPEG